MGASAPAVPVVELHRDAADVRGLRRPRLSSAKRQPPPRSSGGSDRSDKTRGARLRYERNHRGRRAAITVRMCVCVCHVDVAGTYLCGLQVGPDVCQRLPSLTSLNIRQNQLRQLPATLGMLRSLTSLNVGGNRLSYLPSAISSCRALKVGHHVQFACFHVVSD